MTTPTARAYAGHRFQLPGGRDDTGRPTVVAPYVTVRLASDGVDPATGATRYVVPREAFAPGAHLEIAALPPGSLLIHDIPRPHQPSGDTDDE